MRGRECIVLGAGPSLNADLKKLRGTDHLNKVLIPADGMTSAALKYRNPDVIATGLDGVIDD